MSPSLPKIETGSRHGPPLARRVPKLAASALFAFAVVAAGCGQSSDETSATASSEAGTTAESTSTSAEQSTTTQTDSADSTDSTEADSTDSTEASATEANFPSVEVLDLASGEMINLSDTLSQGTTPVVFWFWAPH